MAGHVGGPGKGLSGEMIKMTRLGVLTAVCVVAPMCAVAATGTGLAQNGGAAVLRLASGGAAVVQLGLPAPGAVLLATMHASLGLTAPQVKPNKNTDKKDDKGKLHGAEMSTTAIAIAGISALSAYFLLVRRKSRRRSV